MWPLVLASGIVGSRPDLVRWARGLEKLQKTDEYEVLRDSVVTKYQGVLVSGHVGPRSGVVRWAHGLVWAVTWPRLLRVTLSCLPFNLSAL